MCTSDVSFFKKKRNEQVGRGFCSAFERATIANLIVQQCLSINIAMAGWVRMRCGHGWPSRRALSTRQVIHPVGLPRLPCGQTCVSTVLGWSIRPYASVTAPVMSVSVCLFNMAPTLIKLYTVGTCGRSATHGAMVGPRHARQTTSPKPLLASAATIRPVGGRRWSLSIIMLYYNHA